MNTWTSDSHLLSGILPCMQLGGLDFYTPSTVGLFTPVFWRPIRRALNYNVMTATVSLGYECFQLHYHLRDCCYMCSLSLTNTLCGTWLYEEKTVNRGFGTICSSRHPLAVRGLRMSPPQRRGQCWFTCWKSRESFRRHNAELFLYNEKESREQSSTS